MASVDHMSVRFLGSYGGVLIAGLSKNSAQDAMLIGAALQCRARSEHATASLLFRTPLEILAGNRKMEAGLNVLDLSIQGYRFVEPLTSLVRRHVLSTFKMIASRSPEIASQIDDPTHRALFEQASAGLLCMLTKGPDNITDAFTSSFERYDNVLQPELQIDYVLQDGDNNATYAQIGTATVVNWLANFLDGSETAMLLQSLPPKAPLPPPEFEKVLRSATRP